MFTGIVQDVGYVSACEPRGGDLRMSFTCERLDPAAWRLGDSVSVQGCCLTVVAVQGRAFAADVSRETLRLTTLGQLAVGARVNLELALRLGDALGGHLVTGHVDGLGRVLAVEADARSCRMEVALADQTLARFVARKGSVAVDGVSLTVNLVHGASFSVNLIPHTREVTTLGALQPQHLVNIEVDLMARYAERLTAGAPGGAEP